MHFVYIDDSGDDTRSCFAALVIPADQWRESLSRLLDVRRSMRQSDGVYVKKEMHATDWNGGKGHLAPTPISKERRARLFDYFLTGVAMLPGAQLITACAPRHRVDIIFERMLNRIQVNVVKSGSQAIIFCDEGKSYDAIKRRVGIYNYIPSKLGSWGNGQSAKNIPADRILEDIVYRDSARSILIQAADAAAYALLRRERPIPSKTAVGLDRSFFLLEPIMVKQAFWKDPYGIIRDT